MITVHVFSNMNRLAIHLLREAGDRQAGDDSHRESAYQLIELCQLALAESHGGYAAIQVEGGEKIRLGLRRTPKGLQIRAAGRNLGSFISDLQDPKTLT